MRKPVLSKVFKSQKQAFSSLKFHAPHPLKSQHSPSADISAKQIPCKVLSESCSRDCIRTTIFQGWNNCCALQLIRGQVYVWTSFLVFNVLPCSSSLCCFYVSSSAEELVREIQIYAGAGAALVLLSVSQTASLKTWSVPGTSEELIGNDCTATSWPQVLQNVFGEETSLLSDLLMPLTDIYMANQEY